MTDCQKVNMVLPPILFESFQEFLSMYQSLYSKSSAIKKRSPLMIVGAPGVGKTLFSEVFVESYKKEFAVADGKIKRLNIAAIPKGLIEGNLFGYKKGAFTGAVNNYAGLVGELAEGILVLDEIGELSKEVQAKLLTFIEDGYYYSLGDDKKNESRGLQIVATTNKTFKDGYFRQDFFDRFFPFYIPPLYQRRRDTLYYWAYLFPKLTKKLSEAEVLTTLAYNWPGNVREIERVGQQIIWKIDYGKRIKDMNPYRQKPLYNIASGYSEIDIWKTEDIWNELDESGIDTSSVDDIFNDYGVSLSPRRSRLKPFPEYEAKNIDFDNRYREKFGAVVYKPNEYFDSAYEGLKLYCNAFRQDIFGNKDLLDLSHGIYDPPKWAIVRLADKKKKSKVAKKKDEELLNELRKFTDLKACLEQNTSNILNNESVSDDASKDIYSMQERDLMKHYYRGLIERSNGNKAEAARRAGLNYRTFMSCLSRYDI